MRLSHVLFIAALLFLPLGVAAQTGGGTGGSSGSASQGTGTSAGQPSSGALTGALTDPNSAASRPPGDQSGGVRNSPLPGAPGTNAAGTAQSSGSAASGSSGSVTTGTAGRPSGGVSAQGPNRPGDVEIRAEDPKVDRKIKSICKGC